MKRACNWGWRPTEGRQKRPCLDAYLLCAALLKKIDQCPDLFILCRELKPLDSRQIAGLIETLNVFIDNPVSYTHLDVYKRQIHVSPPDEHGFMSLSLIHI